MIYEHTITGKNTSQSKMQNPDLSIVIPFYNELKNIPEVLQEYSKFKNKYDFELVCVNNGSTDGSEKIFDNFSRMKKYNFIKIITIKKNVGYGHGIMTGVKKSKGEAVAWTHADMQTSPSDVFRAYELYKKLNDKKILVKGSRVDRPRIDTLVSLCMGFLATIVLRVPLYEINAQPKLFHRSLIPKLLKAPDDFMLDLFLLYKAKKLGYKIYTFKVNFRKRLHGKSKWAYSLPSRIRMIRRTIQYINSLVVNSF